jgi:hypothetical protein
LTPDINTGLDEQARLELVLFFVNDQCSLKAWPFKKKLSKSAVSQIMKLI